MKKILFTFVFIVFVFCTLRAQSIIGTWCGDLKINNDKPITIVLHINGFNAGEVLFDSPDQYAFGIKCDSTRFYSDSVFIRVKSIGLSILGYYNTETDSIYTVLKQSGYSFELNFKRGEYVKEKVVRKQDPQTFPYICEDVSINSVDDVILSGTLTIPNEITGTGKIVVLVSGSGAQDRNEEIFDHRPFLVLSDFLTRNGISVLRYDDRGTAQSTGDFATANTYDLSLDAESVVRYIKSRDDLKNMSLGLIGHSEGGMIAPMVASRNPDVDFIVMLAAPGVPISTLMLDQNIDLMKANHTPYNIIKIETQAVKQIYSVLNNNSLTIDEKKKKIFAIRKRSYSKYLTEMTNDDIIDSEINSLLSNWFQYFITFNPQNYLKKVKVPSLALNGSLDLQVRADKNLKGIENSYKKAKNNNITTIKLPFLNHLFQKCLYGNVNLYSKNSETFNEEAMGIIAKWINEK